MNKIIIAGGSGYLGQYLAEHWVQQGKEIIILSRSARPTKNGITYLAWDGKTLGAWQTALEGAQALINLAGRTVDCRYTAENKRQIMDSRVDSTRILGEAIAACTNPPKVWFNSSTATIYNDTRDDAPANDESSQNIGSDFSMTVAKEWERALHESDTPNTRKIALRISIVLGKGGGAIVPLLALSRFWLGGAQGGGNQWFSWVHIEDVARSIDFLLADDTLQGVFNIAQPEPMRNKDVMRALRRAVRRSWGLPMPAFLLRIGAIFIRTEAELVLKSRKVVSSRLPKAGFSFKYENLDEALREITQSKQ
jgi:uncharacterized protein